MICALMPYLSVAEIANLDGRIQTLQLQYFGKMFCHTREQRQEHICLGNYQGGC